MMCGRWPRLGTRDRGAVVVEFALLLPILLLLVFGMIDFGRALNAQITLTQAAREGARQEALHQLNTPDNAVQRAEDAATGLSGVQAKVIEPCPGVDAKVQTSYTFSFITPVGAFGAMFGHSGLGSPITLTATGVMPCET
jgi:hypothetical protein